MKNTKNIIYDSALYLLLLMFIMLFLTFTLFYLNIEMSVFNPLLSLLFSSIIFYILKKSSPLKYITKIIGISLFVFFVMILIQSFIFDRSSDGNTYHKDAISNLKNGWNPIYQSSSEFTKMHYDNTGYNMEVYTVWKDHYSKANWVMEANIYCLTGNIESGKAINLVFMYILFALSFYYFSYKLGNKKGIVLSLCLTFNPITCAQLFSFYNDQLATTILFSLIISLIVIIDNKDNRGLIEKFYPVCLLFIIALNIKFNVLGYALVFTFVFMLKYLYDLYKEKKLKSYFIKLVLLFFVLFFISLVYIGYSTYITNFLDHGNPFFPVYGENGEDIITAQQPSEFLSYNNFQKVFYANFSKTNNLMENRHPVLKIPFLFDLEEIRTSASIDTRIGGFGVLYSGILILSITIILCKFKSMTKKEKEIITIILICILGITFGISEGWWARYNPSFYLITVIAIYMLLKSNFKIFDKLIITTVIINTLIILMLNTGYTLKESFKTYCDFVGLKNHTILYNFNYGEPIGILSNLDDFKIKYKYNNKVNEKVTFYNYLKYKEVVR